jgi:hypothetical protein
MRHLFIAGCLMISAQLPAQMVPVFPSTDTITGQPPIDNFRREWYSKHLVAMSEPILPESPGETYRFLWLRSFHHPVSVRVVCIDNACELTGLRTDGQGGYAPGSVVERKTRRLSDAEIVSFREMLARAQFWRPQPVDDRLGDDRIVLDGAQWILEGRRGQTYHLRDVWSPEKSGPYAVFRELCLHLVRLSGLAVRQDDIY